jgi:N-carbamoylputrescine amidase
VIGQAEDEPQILIAKCSLSEIESTRQNWPFLRDRRVDAYQGLSKLYLDDDE